MITIPLPFNTGQVTVNPTTLEHVWDHPILNVGSSYATLRFEVKEWLNQTCKGNWWFGYNNRTYELRFENDEDAIMFALRWK